MSEPMWEAEAVVETQGEERPEAAHEEPVALAVSVDDFLALEERLRRAVELVKRERQARAAAEERAAELESRATEFEAHAKKADAQLHEQSPMMEQLQIELSALRSEREQVRQRVERLLKQLDALEL